ncbi:unnamed protein product, partial [Nesidiocoris tenuis]
MRGSIQAAMQFSICSICKRDYDLILGVVGNPKKLFAQKMMVFNPSPSEGARLQLVILANIKNERWSEMLTDYQTTVENEYTVEGNVGVLKCRIRVSSGASLASNRIKVVNWLRQDAVNGPRHVVAVGPKYAITQGGSLHIAQTTLQDAQAIFYCQTMHTLTGKRKLSSAGKVFLAADAQKNTVPRIEHATATVHAKTGDPADLVCTGYGTPPPVYRIGRPDGLWNGEGNGQTCDTGFSRLINSMDPFRQNGQTVIKNRLNDEFDGIKRFPELKRWI